MPPHDGLAPSDRPDLFSLPVMGGDTPPSLVRGSAVWVSLLLFALAFLVFGRSLGAGFVNYDDNMYVTDNRYVVTGLTAENVRFALTTFETANWYPLTWLSLQLDTHLFGARALGFHYTNVLLHSLNSLLLFWVLWGMTRSLWPSGFSAAMFAVHPLHVDSVAWISCRKDVLSGFFAILALGAYAWYAARPRWGRYGLVALLFALSLAAKSMLVTLPFVLLLLDYWPLGRFRWAPRGPVPSDAGGARTAATWWLALEKVPLLGLSAASGALTFLAQRGGGARNPWEKMPIRSLNAVVSYATYLVKTFWPHGLVVFYPYPTDFPLWQAFGATLLLAVVTVAVFLLARRGPYLVVGWLWYLGMLVPVIGLAEILGGHAMADRYTYLPLVGVFLMVSWGADDVVRSRRVPWAVPAVGSAGALAACVALTWVQIGYWHDSVSLWRHALDVNPDNWVAHHNLGDALGPEGDPEERMFHFREGLRTGPRFADPHVCIGIVLIQQGKYGEAIRHFERALQIQPDNPVAHAKLGIALNDSGRPKEAERHWTEAVRLNPRNVEAHLNLGLLCGSEGKFDRAVAHYCAALESNPESAAPLCNLVAWTMATHPDRRVRNGTLALTLAQKICEQTANPPADFLDTLAAALAENGRFEEAAAVERKVVDEAGRESPERARAMGARLTLYRSRRPYRDPQGKGQASAPPQGRTESIPGSGPPVP